MSQKERRRDYPEIRSKLLLIESELRNVNSIVNEEKVNLKRVFEELIKFHDKVIEVQGYGKNLDIKIDNLAEIINKVDTKLERNYVNKQEFHPVRLAVYGQLAIVVSSVITAVVMLVVNSGK